MICPRCGFKDSDVSMVRDKRQLKIKIERDLDPLDPRENFDHLGTMVLFHKRYVLGDKDHGYRVEDYSGWDELEKDIREKEEASIVIPVYGYDHGGLTINTTPFSCPWDSGQLGFIFVSDATLLREYEGDVREAALDKGRRMLIAEVQEYDQYLLGDSWGFVIEDDDGDVVESCWGFYGREDCEAEAKRCLAAARR